MWRIEQKQRSPDAWSWRVVGSDESEVSFGEMLMGLEQDEAFLDLWSSALADCPFAAYCWECPPLDAHALNRPFECRLIESPLLRGSRPDPTPFTQYFGDGQEVAVFSSLGKDATLIAPCPRAERDFAHLAQFQRSAETAQIHAFWREIGRQARVAAARGPVWLRHGGTGRPLATRASGFTAQVLPTRAVP